MPRSSLSAGEFFKSLDVNGDGKLSMVEAKGFFIETYVESAGIVKERREKAELEQFRHLMQARTYIPPPLVSVCFSFKWSSLHAQADRGAQAGGGGGCQHA